MGSVQSVEGQRRSVPVAKKIAGVIAVAAVGVVVLVAVFGGDDPDPGDRRAEISKASDCFEVSRILIDENHKLMASQKAGDPDMVALTNVQASRARRLALHCDDPASR